MNTQKKHGIKEIRNIKTPARLAQYIDADGYMAEEGVSALLKILHSFKQISEKYHITDIYPMATAAIRQSKNREDILKRIKAELDLDAKIISGEMEAALGFEAAVHTISYCDAVTIDIGGGSTELTFYEDKEIIYSISLSFGVVTLNKMFF